MTVKRLMRSSRDKMVFGVCGGLGEYFSLDPVIFRAIFVALALLQGTGLILYIILALVMPETKEAVTADAAPLIKAEPKPTAGLLLIVLGALLLLGNLLPQFSLRDWWPLLVIVLGVAMLMKGISLTK